MSVEEAAQEPTRGRDGKRPDKIHVTAIRPRASGKGSPNRRSLIRWASFLLVAVVIVGVAIGLGVGLRMGHRNAPASASPTASPNNDTSSTVEPDSGLQYAVGGSIDPAYYSKKGVFNGTGIAFAGLNQQEIRFVVFQHWKGDIRYILMYPDGSWKGGSPSETVATNARNATPISTVLYILEETLTWHVFYINQGGYVQQRTSVLNGANNATASVATYNWMDGELNSLALKALDADTPSLRACWYPHYATDSDLADFRSRGSVPGFGMHLWFAGDESTIHQYGYYEGQPSWTQHKSWPHMNGHGGVACYSWNDGNVTYAMFINRWNSMEVWWRDASLSVASTDAHPISDWRNASTAALPNMFSTTSLDWWEFLSVQAEDRSIQLYDIDFNAENTTWALHDTVGSKMNTTTITPLPGTHTTIGALDDLDNITWMMIFHQQRGDDLTIVQQNWEGGPWSMREIEIPHQ